MEPNIYDRFDSLNTTLQENHIDVVQRLTALETSLKGIPERVQTLENKGASLSGSLSVWTIVVNLIIAAVGFFFKKHT